MMWGINLLTTEKEVPEHLLGREVIGTTFKVYLHLLKVKRASAREVYHTLEMSSPWLATYHLNKLSDLQLVNKDVNGVYHINLKRFGLLHFFIVTGRWIIPRTFFYTLFFLSMAIYFLYSLPEKWNIIAFSLLLIPTLINIIETILFYRTLSKSVG